MRKLVLILLVSIAVATFIRAYDTIGGISTENTEESAVGFSLPNF